MFFRFRSSGCCESLAFLVSGLVAIKNSKMEHAGLLKSGFDNDMELQKDTDRGSSQ
jgi:hypothetical protein